MRLAAVAVGALIALVVAGAAAVPARTQAESPFAGLGTWIDIYDGPQLAAPRRTADRIAARGVVTAWVETANYKAATDVVRPTQLGRLVEALHARGIRVVAWYLPGFDRPARDLRRTRAMLSFRTSSGQAFDGVALDIEALAEKNVAKRNARLLSLSRTLRAEAGDVPVAAIVYAPRLLERHPTWWPRFPWSELAAEVDAFAPMAYTGSAFPGYDATYGYVARSLRIVRDEIGPDLPIHAAGGVADRMGAEELDAFADAAVDAGVAGWSLYDFATTNERGWRALASIDP